MISTDLNDALMAAFIFWASWIWTGMALIGLLFSALVWSRARGDLAEVIKNNINGGDRIVATRNLRNARRRTINFVLFIVVGLVSSMTPVRPDSGRLIGYIGVVPIYTEYLRVLMSAVFLWFDFTFMQGAMLDWRDRQHLMETIAIERERIAAAKATGGVVGGMREADHVAVPPRVTVD